MIRTMAVVGTGLIGTSVALAARRRGVAVHLQDENEEAVTMAVALGAGVGEPPASPVDLAVIAVPPSRVVTVLAEQRGRRLAEAYTDVTSVKSQVAQAVFGGGPAPADFIGGHPLAGRERSGPLAARADLFEDRPWVLTPYPETPRPILNRALELVSLCGATPVLMAEGAHDTAVALISHVPHLVASLMAARLLGASPEALRLAGQGVRDVTRTAAGAPRLWTEILQANAPAIAAILRELTEDLARARSALDDLAASPTPAGAEPMKTLADLLERGVAGVNQVSLRETRGGPQVQMRVSVGRRPGELARLLASLAEFGIGPDDMTPVHSPRQGTLSVLFAAPSGPARSLIRDLAREGWEAEIWDPEARRQKAAATPATDR